MKFNVLPRTASTRHAQTGRIGSATSKNTRGGKNCRMFLTVVDEQGNVLILIDYIIVNNKLIPRRDREHSSELANALVNEEEQGEGEDLEIEQENTDNTNFVWNELVFFK
ncbi:hypothetical protein QE152_g17956 [Popillia japonica]|uniref:Uncharacterized protein n=1 Tax=Popillia japonica TaxID=7064 RepID=A0AAW1L4V2_POPJA